jgi:hypothetical protein
MSYIHLDRQALITRAAGFVAENYDISTVTNNTILVSQRIYFALVPLRKGDVITNIHVAIATASATTTNCFAAIYDSAGNRLAVSNDLTTTLDAVTGIATLPLSAAYTVLKTDVYYFAVLWNATTPPVVGRGGSSSTFYAGIGSGVRRHATQSTQTSMPTTATLTTTSLLAVWMASS